MHSSRPVSPPFARWPIANVIPLFISDAAPRLRRFQPTRFLLFVEPPAHVAPRRFGHRYRRRLFHYSVHAALDRPQAPRHSLQLDLRPLRAVYRRLRRYSRDGGVEHLAHRILAGRRSEGHYRARLHLYRDRPRRLLARPRRVRETLDQHVSKLSPV